MELSNLILQWNCRGFKNKKIFFRNHTFRNSLIWVLQETWLNSSDKVHIANKVIFRNDRLSNKRGGGLLIAIDKKIPAVVYDIDPPNSNTEVQGINIWWKKNG